MPLKNVDSDFIIMIHCFVREGAIVDNAIMIRSYFDFITLGIRPIIVRILLNQCLLLILEDIKRLLLDL